MAGIILAGWLFTYYSLYRFRLKIDTTTVTYSSLFTRETTVQRPDITSADFAETTGALESPFTFSIRTASGEELRINAKVFSLEAVKALFDLGEKKGALEPRLKTHRRKKRKASD